MSCPLLPGIRPISFTVTTFRIHCTVILTAALSSSASAPRLAHGTDICLHKSYSRYNPTRSPQAAHNVPGPFPAHPPASWPDHTVSLPWQYQSLPDTAHSAHSMYTVLWKRHDAGPMPERWRSPSPPPTLSRKLSPHTHAVVYHNLPLPPRLPALSENSADTAPASGQLRTAICVHQTGDRRHTPS